MRILGIMNQSNPRGEFVAQTSIHFLPHKIGYNTQRNQEFFTRRRLPPAYGVDGTRAAIKIINANLGNFTRIINDRQQLTAQAIKSFNETSAREAKA